MALGRDTIRAAAIVYRRLAAPIALPKLSGLLRAGLPAAFAAPIRYLFDGRLTADERRAVARVEAMRHALAQRPTYFVGASKETPIRPYSAERITGVASIPPDWGTCLYLLAKAARARTILELGSCAGISGCYLASADSCERFVTVEGSPQLAQIAEGHLRQISSNATVVNEMFDVALDRLADISPIDLAFIDGDHTNAGRHNCVRRIRPHLTRGGIIVFDDVHFSEDMWRTWHELRQLPGVVWAVNFGRLGACVFDTQSAAPARYLDLSPFTAWTRVGNRWKRPSELWGRTATRS